jgi:nucleoside-diphosphate-sugar epimerase
LRVTAPGLVVVSGADGFLGSALCSRLRAEGTPLRGLVRSLTAATAARPDVLAIGDLKLQTEAGLANALLGAQTIVHLAGRAHVMRETAADPLREFRAANVAATERLARAAATAGAAHFVFASSVKVNGETTAPGHAFRENDPPDPRDAYAMSKWEAECALADVARDTGMAVTILRLPVLYGPGARGNIARLTSAIARGMPLPFASIDNRRSLLGSGNFSSGVLAVLARPPHARHAATYFLADAQPVSTPQLIRAIGTALGVRPRLMPVAPSLIHFVAAFTGRAAAVDRLTRSLVVDTSAFRAAFGCAPPRSLADELGAMVRALRDA